jgi:hypothetical protein
VLDANYTPAQSTYGLTLGNIAPVAQTFTVQNTGILSLAAVKIEAVDGSNQAFGGGVTLEITTTFGGLPSLSAPGVLGSATIATSLFPVEGQSGYRFIDFSLPNIQVTAGEQLAIRLASTASGYFGVNGDLGGCCGPDGTYAGGQGLAATTAFSNGQFQVTGWESPLGYPADFAFETFVTTAVPEPSTWAMMILGFCGLGFMAYRRKQNGTALSVA